MTDFNASVLQPQNKTVSFCAFEKERWKKIWDFIMHKKLSDKSADIGVYQLAWKVYKDMRGGEAKKAFIQMNICTIFFGVIDGIKPYIDLLLYGSLPAVLTGSEKDRIIFMGFVFLSTVQKILNSMFMNMGGNIGYKFQCVYFNQKSTQRYKEILDKPRVFFIKNAPGIIRELVDSITQAEANLLTECRYTLKHILTFFVATMSLFVISPFATVFVVLLSLIRLEYDFYWSNYFRGKNHKNRMFSAKVRAVNRDILRNSPLVQNGMMTRRECLAIRRRLNLLTRNEVKVKFAETRNSMAGFYVGEIVFSFLAAFLAVADILKTGDIGRFALISGAIYYMTGSINTFRYVYLNLCLRNRNTILDTEKQLITPLSLGRKCGNKKLYDVDNTIILKGVKFSYPKIEDITNIRANEDKIERGEEVLRGINVEITKGGVTVIAGTSGQGKSTLMSLIRHDYDVTDGEILLGNENVQDLSDETINKQIAFVDQNVHFFDNTLLYNVKYFNQEASDEEVQNALEVAGLTNDIARFKDGVFHKIGQDGRALSGGQRQRLALARTFLADRPIVIMDEPTTGLDQVLSFKVMRVLQKLAKNKTVLLVTHNPTEIALADRVLIVQEGKIVADGSPLELIESSSFLSSAMTKQDILSKQKLFNKH